MLAFFILFSFIDGVPAASATTTVRFLANSSKGKSTFLVFGFLRANFSLPFLGHSFGQHKSSPPHFCEGLILPYHLEPIARFELLAWAV